MAEVDRIAFIDLIMVNPDAGDIDSETGGGDVWVTYFYHFGSMPHYLLLIDAKTRQENWAQKRHGLGPTMSICQAHKKG